MMFARQGRVLPLITGLLVLAPQIVFAQIERHDFKVPSEPGIELFVREVRTDRGGPPVLLIHGGGPGGLAVFDPDAPGYSLASTIATAGYDTYIMDVREFGRSTRSASLNPADPSAPPVGTSEEAVRDIGAVVKWNPLALTEREGCAHRSRIWRTLGRHVHSPSRR